MKNTPSKHVIFIVSLINAIANLLLGIAKIVIGKIANSQALIADGVHSFSDLISDGLVFFAANASMQLPDKEHPYGHRRIETIATLVIACLLLSIAFAIGYEALRRLLNHLFYQPEWPAVVVAVLSVLVNEALFHYSRRKGLSIQSNLLISNAWHKRSDSFTSLIVLLSILGGYFGFHWLDPVGALIITLLIMHIAFKMIWRAGQELIDRAVDENTLKEIKLVIEAIPGVQALHQLRTRLHGSAIFVDMHILVNPTITVSEGHHIGEIVHAALNEKIKSIADVVVHIDPEDDETGHPSLDLPNRAALEKILQRYWENLPGYSQIKKINLHYFSGKVTVEIMLPLTVLSTIAADELREQYRTTVKEVAAIKSVEIVYV